MRLALPQAGVITSIDNENAQAKVVLPLFKIETDWIPLVRHLVNQLEVGDEVVVVFLNGNLNDGRIIAGF